MTIEHKYFFLGKHQEWLNVSFEEIAGGQQPSFFIISFSKMLFDNEMKKSKHD